MATIVKNLGPVTAYGYAKEHGYTGTEEEFAELMASYAEVAEEAAESAEAAAQSATEAAGSASAAEDSAAAAAESKSAAAASETAAAGSASSAAGSAAAAATSETNAAGSATAAAGSASTASSKAAEAAQSATDADAAKQAAQAAQGAAETAQAAAETAQGKAEDAQAGAEAAAASLYGVLLDGTNTTRVFWQFWTHYAESATSKFDLLCQFMRMLAAAWSDKKYTLRYLRPEDGSSPDMTPLDDFADKSGPAQLCTDETAPVTDWADEDPMTWYIRANAESLADGTMNITYLEGEQGFDLTGETLPVYTFSLALWLKEWTDGDYNYKSWTTIQQPGAAPYPGDVGVDCKKRDLTWHPTFDGSYNSAGKLTSGVGGKPANRISAGSGIAKARLQSAYDALWGDTDTIWALHTWQLRHWNLENSGICEGCQSYTYTYTAAVSEVGVRRVLVTPAQGANLQVGSNIMVGTNASSDRGAATSFSIADNATILSKETVYVNDVAYCALSLDTVGTFDTTADTTQIMTAPWSSGNTELLPDRKDGACHSLTAGQNPLRLQGVEFMTGAYTVGLDPLYQVTANETAGYDYHVYECRDATKQAGSVTSDYVDTGIIVTGIPSGWQYVKRFVKTVLGVLFPDMFGGSSTTYFKSAFSGAYSAGVRCPWRFGNLGAGGSAGLACEYGDSPGYSSWGGHLRLSGSGKTRGEWAA